MPDPATKAQGRRHFVDADDAIAALRDAGSVDDRLAQALRLQLAGRHAEAEAAYRACIAHDPRSAAAWNNLGALLSITGRRADARAAWRTALRIEPDHAQALAALGGSLAGERPLRALPLLRRALDLQPDNPTAWSNLGICLQALSRTDEAIAALERALQHEPRSAQAMANLGGLLYGQQCYEEAEAVLRRAIAIAPHLPVIAQNLHMALLGQGRLQDAWPFQEAALAHLLGDDAPRGPRWRGEPLAGRGLLVWQDQGHGDEIQSVRFAPLLKQAGAGRVTLACAAELQSLLGRAAGVDEVVTRRSRPERDLWIPTSAVPAALGLSLATIPACVPYLHAPDERVQAWRQRLPTGLKVGLAWRGSPAHPNDADRSIAQLDALAPLWATQAVRFIGLQKGAGSERDAARPRPAQPLLALGEQIRDFADMAAVISQLDLVIGVDTAVIHLAGALGKPVWVLLPAWRTDWRWLRDRADSPWYPGLMRLYRQAQRGQWGPVIDKVAADLVAWEQGKRAARAPVSPAHARAAALLDQAQQHEAAGRTDEAKAAYAQALAADPRSIVALNNLAHLLIREERKDEGEALLRELLRLEPLHPQGNMNLGLLLTELRREHEALPFAQRAVALRPRHALAWINLAACHDGCGQREEGLAACRKALDLEPGNALALASLATLVAHGGELQRAEQLFRQALQASDKPPTAELGLFLVLLGQGRYREAWPMFGAAVLPSTKPPPRAMPLWSGEPLAGRSILVWQEQGFGDVIQFVRFAPLLKQAGAGRVTLACLPTIGALMARVPGIDEVVGCDDVPQRDAWIPTFGLPAALGTALDELPAALPYLQPSPQKIEAWKARLPAGLKIGLAWRGNPRHRNDAQRSIRDFRLLAPLWQAAGVTFVRLQAEAADRPQVDPHDPAQPSLPIGDEVRDFDDLAAVVAQMDLVVSVDTAVAHLAGALGKPVWVLLPAWATDWRWLQDRGDSPWYPGVMRVWRQRTAGDWAGLLDAVARELQAWTHGAARPPAVNQQPAASPPSVSDLIDAASMHERAGAWEAAAAAYRELLALQPASAPVRNNLANALIRGADMASAEEILRELLRSRPDDPHANFNLGVVLIRTGRHGEALAFAQRAVDLMPANPQAWNNLGVCLAAATRAQEAKAAYERALQLAPGDAEVLGNLGGLLSHAGRHEQAETVIRRLLAAAPGSQDANLKLFFLLLAQGRLQEAWPLYDSAIAPLTPAPEPDCPRWRGEPLQGRSVLVWHEQGHGDTIQFIRYAPMLKKRGAARVTLACPPELAALLAHAPGVDDVATSRPLPRRDVWVGTLGLPAAFGTRLGMIPARIPYLAAPPSRVEPWRDRLPADLRVGLAWRGSPAHANDAQRSIHDFGVLAPLWRVPGLAFVSLQHGASAGAPPAQPLMEPGGQVRDFADLAALVSQLDLVITVDSAVAHLAGAMGKPTWVLLPAWRTDWRWLRHGTDTAWYPRVMRLYRQAAPGRWAGTVERVAADLAAWAASAAEAGQVRR